MYFFGIWDSYRTTVEMNKVYLLAEHEEHRFNIFSMGSLEINYLDKRIPVMAAFWSAIVPGLGQIYIHKIVTGFFGILWFVVFGYLSHVFEATLLLILGEVRQATSVLRGEFLLMIPSMYGFAIYDAYVSAVEDNKLFEREQRRFLKENYQDPNFQPQKGQKVE